MEMKPRFVIAVLLVFALAVPVSMLAQQNSKEEKEIRAVMEEMRQSVIKGNPEYAATLEKYCTEDMVRIPGYGRLIAGTDYLAAAKKGTTTVE
jgi:hypothetical protein